MAQRHQEIDLLRTVAIVMMVAYHLAFDLEAFYHWPIDLSQSGWEALRITTASLFLLVAGISSRFSNRPLRRAFIVLGAAALVSIATYLYDPRTFIYFGILHCIGFGLLLLIPLNKFKEWNIILGSVLLILHNSSLFTLNSQLFTLHSPTLDYYPLFPWFGLMLIGSGLGHYLYQRKKLSLDLAPPAWLTFPGRHALFMYLVHQPVLLFVLWVINVL